MRDVTKAIQEGRAALKNHRQSDSTIPELGEIIANSAEDWDMAHNGFLFGVAIGMRLEKAKRAAKRKVDKS